MRLRSYKRVLAKAGITGANTKRFNINVGGSMRGFLPKPLANEVIDFISEQNVMRRIVNVFTLPSRRWDKPLIDTQIAAYGAQDGEEALAQNFTTSQLEFNAKKLMVQALIDTEVFEDSQIAVQPKLLEQFAQAMADAEETALTIGDTSLTHTAASLAAATANNLYKGDPRAALFDGVFTLAQADSTHARGAAATSVSGAGSVLTHEQVNTAIFYLGKYGQNPRDLVLLVDDWQASRLRVSADIKQVQVTGMNISPIIDGEIGTLHRIPVMQVPKGSESVAVVMYRPYAQLGDRRLVKIESERVPASDQTRFVASERLDFKYMRNEALCAITGLTTGSVSSS